MRPDGDDQRSELLLTKLIFRLPLMALLTACVPIAPSLERPNVPSAKIRVAVVEGSNAQIQRVSNGQCDSRQQEWLADLGTQLAIDRGSGRRVGMPLGGEFNPKLMTEISVASNLEYSIEIRGLLPSRSLTSAPHCRKIVTFTPQSAGLYEVQFSLTASSCSVKVFSLVRDAADVFVRLPFDASINANCSQRFLW